MTARSAEQHGGRRGEQVHLQDDQLRGKTNKEKVVGCGEMAGGDVTDEARQ